MASRLSPTVLSHFREESEATLRQVDHACADRMGFDDIDGMDAYSEFCSCWHPCPQLTEPTLCIAEHQPRHMAPLEESLTEAPSTSEHGPFCLYGWTHS